MVPSVLAACFFAASGICGRRAALGLGPLRANAFRLVFAALLLGCWVGLRHPVNFSTRAVHWLLVSGVVGFGIGDVCLFLAYPRIGARLTMLVSLCSAPVFGALLDWQLQGLSLSLPQVFASLMILSGVVLALLGGHGQEGRRHPGSVAGVVSALMAGFGQGCGAALSRHAQAFAVADGTMLDGVSQAFVRTLPGMTFSITVWMLVARIQKVVWPPGSGKHPWGWLTAAVVFGPVLGVSCFQWALSLQNSVLVLSVTATAPVLIMPLAAWLDGDRPVRLAIAGATLAVVGVIVLLRLAPA